MREGWDGALQPGEEKAPEGPDCGVSGLKGKYSLGNTGRGFPERQWMPHPWKHSSQAHSRMDSEQPHLIEDVPPQCRGIGLDDI